MQIKFIALLIVASLLLLFINKCDVVANTDSSDEIETGGTNPPNCDRYLKSGSIRRDLVVLQQALALNQFEVALFNTGLSTFPSPSAAGVSPYVYSLLVLIRDQHLVHIANIEATITRLGAQLPPTCTFSFSFPNFTSFLEFAVLNHELSISVNVNNAQYITLPDVRVMATGMTTVNARHAGFLRYISGLNPFPNAVDPPLTFATVFQMGAQYFNCPPDVICLLTTVTPPVCR